MNNMSIKCKYTRGSEESSLSILCKIRYLFDVTLSEDEKRKVIHFISIYGNVPKKYEEIYNSINNIVYPPESYSKKELVFTTHSDNTCYIEIMLKFSKFANFEKFVKENGLSVGAF